MANKPLSANKKLNDLIAEYEVLSKSKDLYKPKGAEKLNRTGDELRKYDRDSRAKQKGVPAIYRDQYEDID